MSMPLALRDVHPGNAPGWWPPAPGWWMVTVILVIFIGVITFYWSRRRSRQAALLRLFGEAVDRAETPSLQVAAMSQLLRRAARRRDPAADRLEGDAWLQFLDGDLPGKPFSTGAGALLRDGGFREEVAADEVAALHTLAYQRYLSWMQQK